MKRRLPPVGQSPWRLAGALLVLRILISVPAAHSQDAIDRPTWSDRRNHSVEVDTAYAATISGRAYSALFNGFAIRLDGPGDRTVVNRAIAVEAGVVGARSRGAIQFEQQLRGAISKDADSRVIITVILPDQTLTLVYRYGRRLTNMPIERNIRSRMNWRSDQRYAITVLMRVERRSPSSSVNVSIDSWDVEVFQR